MDTNMDENDVQQALLDKLMQYGDSLLDTEDYERRKADVSNKSKKKHKKKPQNEDKEDILHTQSSGSAKQSSLKVKKKRKKSKQTEDDELTHERTHKKKRKYLEDFDEELRTYKQESQNVVSGDGIECEREEENGAKSEGPEFLVFDDPSKRKKKRQEEEAKQVDFDLDKARLEVLKFGYSGFDYNDRKKFEQERAIKLGAKAPKREYKNYKLLQQQLKQQRNYERNKREKDRQLGMPVKAKSDEKNPSKTVLRHHGFWKDRSIDKGFHLDGQVGRYRPGVLWLNRQDIAKVKGKSKKSGNKTNKQQKNSNKTGERSNRTGGKRK